MQIKPKKDQKYKRIRDKEDKVKEDIHLLNQESQKDKKEKMGHK